jgi:nucleotide-binding universal stress UspA family protein
MSTKRFQTIVVGLDFSAYSKKVLQQAQVLGRLYDAEVVAIYSTFDPSKLLDISLTAQAEASTISTITESFKNYYKLGKNKIKAVVAYGSPEDVILSVAKKSKDPLIVVGHKGHSVVSRFLLGSTAERLAQTSTFPVWIHRGGKLVKPHKILVPHDLRKISDSALNVANRLGNGRAPEVEAFFVCQEPLPILYYEGWIAEHNEVLTTANKALAKFKKAHPRVALKSSKGDPVQDILKRGRNFDLIVMRPHSHRESFHSFGKVTSKVIRSAEVPVLVVR